MSEETSKTVNIMTKSMSFEQFERMIDGRFEEMIKRMKSIVKNILATKLNIEEEDVFYDAFETTEASERSSIWI